MRSFLFLSVFLLSVTSQAVMLTPGSVIVFSKEIVGAENPFNRLTTFFYTSRSAFLRRAENGVSYSQTCQLQANVPANSTWIIGPGEYTVQNTNVDQAKRLVNKANPSRTMILDCGPDASYLTKENIELSFSGAGITVNVNVNIFRTGAESENLGSDSSRLLEI